MCCNTIPSKGLIAVGICNMVLGSLLLLISILLPIIFSSNSYDTGILAGLASYGAVYSILVFITGICAYFGGKKSRNVNDNSSPGSCHIIAALTLSIIVLIGFVATVTLSVILPLVSTLERDCSTTCELHTSLKGSFMNYCEYNYLSEDCDLYINRKMNSTIPYACQLRSHSDFFCYGWDAGVLAIIQSFLALFIFGFSLAISIMGCCSICCRPSYPGVVLYSTAPNGQVYTEGLTCNRVAPNMYAIAPNHYGLGYGNNPPSYDGNQIPIPTAIVNSHNSDLLNETSAGPLPLKA